MEKEELKEKGEMQAAAEEQQIQTRYFDIFLNYINVVA